MSADRLVACPRCMAARQAEIDAQEQWVREVYGRLPVDEYLAAVRRLHRLKGPKQAETLAVYASFTHEGIGIVYAEWSAHCTRCGLAGKFEYEHRFYDAERDGL